MRTSTSLRGLGVAAAALLVGLLVAAPIEAATAASGVLRTGLPNRTLTPGTTNPAVTQATIHRTICVSGWTATIRPSSSYTTSLKVRQLATYGFTDRRLADYEEDHLISLELGGSPTSARNLWPEPHHIHVGGLDLGSYAKDGFENHLRSLVCAGRLSLGSAQREIAVNWVAYCDPGRAARVAAPRRPPARSTRRPAGTATATSTARTSRQTPRPRASLWESAAAGPTIPTGSTPITTESPARACSRAVCRERPGLRARRYARIVACGT